MRRGVSVRGALTAQHAGVDVGGTGLESAVSGCCSACFQAHGWAGRSGLTRWRLRSPCHCESASRCRRLHGLVSTGSAGRGKAGETYRRHLSGSGPAGRGHTRQQLVSSFSSQGHGTHVVDLAGRGAADSVGDADAVDAGLVDGAVERQQVDQVGAERVFARD